MEALYQRHCEPCKMGSKVVTATEVNQLLIGVPAWRKEFHEGVEKLIRDFYFIEFKDAFEFTYKIANLAEREKHHPGIYTEWGKVTVYWWSHKINGLHVNDFIMAAKTDMIAKLSRNARQGTSL